MSGSYRCVKPATRHGGAKCDGPLWLEASGGSAALAVLTGGKFEVTRLVELCTAALDATGGADGEEESGAA